MKRLIVNADDFGLSKSINRGILASFQRGIVRSASLSPAGEAFDDAVAGWERFSELDIGVHLTAVEEKPVSPPHRISSLLCADGRFPSDYRRFLLLYWRRGSFLKELEIEFRAQIERLIASGIRPSHLDSHCHVHLLPGCFVLACRLAQDFRIPYVRLPAHWPHWPRMTQLFPIRRLLRGIELAGLSVLSQWNKFVQKTSFLAVQKVTGLAESGRLDKNNILAIFKTIQPGLSELICHPADPKDHDPRHSSWGYDGETELAALTDPHVLNMVRMENIHLTDFRSETPVFIND